MNLLPSEAPLKALARRSSRPVQAAATFAAALLLSGCVAPPAPRNPNAGPQPQNMTRGEVVEYERTARALFAERCKSAGVTIRRTVTGERGIMVMKMRLGMNFGEQYLLNDPYGRDFADDDYLLSFIEGFNDEVLKRQPELKLPRGFEFLDYVNPKDGLRYRYTAKTEVNGRKDTNAEGIKRALARDPNFDLNLYGFVLRGTPTQEPAPRYGVTFDDISTRQDRDYWIAGSSLKVVDLQTGEVIAERIGYMQDPGLGSKAGGRSPWIFAAQNACPRLGGVGGQRRQTISFVRQVLP